MSASGSITIRLAAMIASILAIGGVGVTLAALAYGRQAAEEAYDKLLAGAAFEITRALSVSDGAVTVDLPVSAFEILALAPEDRVFYRVVLPGGETLTGYDALPAPAAAGEAVQFYGAAFRGAPIRLAATRRAFVERAFAGEVEVIVGQTLRARSALAWDIARKALAIVSIVGLVLAALSVLAVRASLGPLRRIERALSERDPLDLTPLDVAPPAEVRAMVGAIDRFMARLAQRVAAMQTLLADATHQLRTPIAALRAQAELAVDEEDSAQLRSITTRIHRRAVGLSRLADQLLNQAMVIHRADAAARARVDLRQVAITVSEEADHDLFASDATLRLDLSEEPVWVEGDAFSLVEATKNLVINAFRHGETPVTLEVRLEAGQGAIAVIDEGPGISAPERARIGERLARSTHRPESAGIGLAIVQAVAEAHGGRLGFDRDSARGFRARLTLPAAA